MVNDVPLISIGALFAIKVENNGESATTINPQKSKNAINKIIDELVINNGSSKQQSPEHDNAIKAALLVPIRSDIKPPKMHPRAPMAIIKKLSKGIFIVVAGW